MWRKAVWNTGTQEIKYSRMPRKEFRICMGKQVAHPTEVGTGCLFLVAVKNELWFAEREFRQELRMLSPEF
jgi:hypothetical protein